MFKQFFFLGLGATVLSSVACMVYSTMYSSMLVDFSEAAGAFKIISGCVMFCMFTVFLAFLLNVLMKNKTVGEMITNLAVSAISMGMVFVILGSDDPVFKNEDAQLMIDYYKGFVMPMLFFPALAWFTLKPLMIRK